MTIRRPLVPFLVASLVLAIGGGVRAQGSNGQDDLEELRAALAAEGSENMPRRVQAIDALCKRRDLAAHAVLQERLRQEEDPDGVRHTILNELQRRMVLPDDPTFGQRQGEGAEKARRELLESYVPVFLALLAGEDEGLRAGARRCFQHGLPSARWEWVRRHLGQAGSEELLEGLKGLSRVRLLGAATVMAPFLGAEDPAVARAADEALAALTFRDFDDPAAVVEWVERQASYEDVAVTAARRARREIEQVRGDARAQVRAARVELVVALLGQREAVPWGRIEKLVLADDPPGLMAAALEAMVPMLEDDAHRGNGAAARRALHSKLVARFDDPAHAEVAPLLLETAAHLLRRGDHADATLRAQLESRLRAALEQDRAELRQAALRGMRRFPSAENRRSVVALVRRCLEGMGGSAGAPPECLRAALATLHHGDPQWTAPAPGDPDSEEWLAVLERVLWHEGLGPLHGEALMVVGLRNPENRRPEEVYGLLERLVTDTGMDAGLRQEAFQILVRSEDAGRLEATMRLALQLLVDPQSPAVRAVAARHLWELPRELESVPEWNQRIINAVEPRLTAETDRDACEAAVRALGQCARRRASDADPVVEALCTAVEATGQGGGEPGFRRGLLLIELQSVAMMQGVDPVHWIRATERLVAQGERVRARAVLGFRSPLSSLTNGNGHDPDLIELLPRALKLIVDTAELLPPGQEFAGGEPAEVVRALELLRERQQLPEGADYRLLRLRALAAAGQDHRLVELGEQALAAEPPLPAAGHARVLVAAAHGRLGQLEDAIAHYGNVPPDSPFANTAAERLEPLVQRLEGNDADLAARGGTVLRRLTPEEHPAFPRRIVLWAETQIAASPENRAAVVAELRSQRDRFDSAPPDLRQRFDHLCGSRDGGVDGPGPGRTPR